MAVISTPRTLYMYHLLPLLPDWHHPDVRISFEYITYASGLSLHFLHFFLHTSYMEWSESSFSWESIMDDLDAPLINWVRMLLLRFDFSWHSNQTCCSCLTLILASNLYVFYSLSYHLKMCQIVNAWHCFALDVWVWWPECWNGIMWDVFWVTTEHSDQELYQIIVQLKAVQMISCWLIDW